VIISKMAATGRLRSGAMRGFVLLILLIGSQQQVNPAGCEHFKLQLELQVEEINIFNKMFLWCTKKRKKLRMTQYDALRGMQRWYTGTTVL
jgi:hypothetical protein